MIVQIKDAQCLEVRTRELDGKTYHNLIVYEFGQQGFPQLIQANVRPEMLDQAKALAGKRSGLNLDMFNGRNRVNFTFAGVIK